MREGILVCVATLQLGLLAADSPLADAVEKSERPAIRTLLKQRTDVNAAQPDGMTALHWAAYRDDFEVAKALVEAKADVGLTNTYGVAPLSLACKSERAIIAR